MWTSRTELLIGKEKIDKLQQSHILIVGLGGVGAAAAECICRAGVGNITIADSDVVQASNINRQLCALQSTIGKPKVDVVAERLRDINRDVNISIIPNYLIDKSIEDIFNQHFDFVIDAIDTLSPKVYFIANCLKNNLPLVSSLGSAGKTDPTQIQIADISKSHGCHFGYDLRKRLHKQQVYFGFTVVFSPEAVNRSQILLTDGTQNKKSVVGTISYMPIIFGSFAASVAIRKLIE